MKKLKIRPLINLGYGSQDLTVIDGSTNGFTLNDAKFKGNVFRYGVGIFARISPRLAITTKGILKSGKCDEVEAISSGELEDDVNSNGYSVSVSLIWFYDGVFAGK